MVRSPKNVPSIRNLDSICSAWGLPHNSLHAPSGHADFIVYPFTDALVRFTFEDGREFALTVGRFSEVHC